MRAFEESDLFELNTWNQERDAPAQSIEDLPKYGLIVDGVCAGFLYETDSNFCLLDNFISNPKSSKLDRKLGLDAVTVALIERAKNRGFNVVLALTKHPGIEERCVRYNFKQLENYRYYMRSV